MEREIARPQRLNLSLAIADGRPIPGVPPVVQNMSISIPIGARCLLLGSNGAGKTTLLKVLGGKHMVPKPAVRVLGVPPFHNTDLTASGLLSYLGGNWDRDIAFAGYSIPMQVRTLWRQFLRHALISKSLANEVMWIAGRHSCRTNAR